MSKLASVWKVATSWYVSLVVLSALGAVIGYYVFFEAAPGKPEIGVIDIPFTVITDDSAFVISAFLEYARSMRASATPSRRWLSSSTVRVAGLRPVRSC